MIVALERSYRSRDGTPVVDQVDTAIFSLRYFTFCLRCDFCHDRCCYKGADVDVENLGRIGSFAAELEELTGIPRSRWFDGAPTDADDEYPGGLHTRTKVVDGTCAFRNREGRGCLLHGFCTARGLDYHILKPLVCSLFPLTFGEGLLCPAPKVTDRDLVCLGTGPTLYRGARDEVRYYFGAGLVAELDRIEAGLVA